LYYSVSKFVAFSKHLEAYFYWLFYQAIETTSGSTCIDH